MKRLMVLAIAAALVLTVFPAVSYAGVFDSEARIGLEGEATPPPAESTAPPVESTAPPVESTAPPVESTAPPVEPTPVPPTAPPVEPTPAPPEPVPTVSVSISISPGSYQLFLGETGQLTPHISPAGDYKVLWSSSDTSIVAVSQSGAITARGIGTVTIRAQINNTAVYATCSVTVKKESVSAVDISGASTTMKIGNSRQVYARTQPSSVTAEVTWSSSDSAVLTVRKNSPQSATVTAVGAGRATLTATADGVSDRVVITVGPVETAPAATPKPAASAAPSALAAPSVSVYADQPVRPSAEPEDLAAAGDGPMAWADIATMIADKPSGVYRIQLPEDTAIPLSVLSVLASRESALEIDLGGYTCTIDSYQLGDIPAEGGPIEIGMTMEKDAAMSEAAEGHDVYQLHFAHSGSLPGRFVYRFSAADSLPGDTLYLYYHDEGGAAVEGLQSAVVDDKGWVAFGFEHFSDYFVSETVIEGAVNHFEQAAATPPEQPEEKQGSLAVMAGFLYKATAAAVGEIWWLIPIFGAGVCTVVLALALTGARKNAGPGRGSMPGGARMMPPGGPGTF